jgi:hypothetical protein
MVARTENVPCTRASLISSSDPRSSGSSKNMPASLVAVHAASAVDSIKTIRFCISSLKPPPPPLLDLPVNLQSIVAGEDYLKMVRQAQCSGRLCTPRSGQARVSLYGGC